MSRPSLGSVPPDSKEDVDVEMSEWGTEIIENLSVVEEEAQTQVKSQRLLTNSQSSSSSTLVDSASPTKQESQSKETAAQQTEKLTVASQQNTSASLKNLKDVMCWDISELENEEVQKHYFLLAVSLE
ncbi:hypothetical protein AURDEDRAFT_157560 [Auricularia subglabra TFB-10046 SS5]|nr:hypothetical protein AURDEDRAFT_157560 [Auricularia subglabra TFB-10046 SS5]